MEFIKLIVDTTKLTCIIEIREFWTILDFYHHRSLFGDSLTFSTIMNNIKDGKTYEDIGLIIFYLIIR